MKCGSADAAELPADAVEVPADVVELLVDAADAAELPAGAVGLLLTQLSLFRESEPGGRSSISGLWEKQISLVFLHL
jgi:hypothetical protein